MNEEYVNDYLKLLIKQYFYKPNASAEIKLLAGSYSKVYDLFNAFFPAYDVDLAVGHQLDVIGRIVGISRNVPAVVAKLFFGFDGDDTARGFADKFDELVESAPFYDKFSSAYTDLQLNDNDYRFFIKAKIAKNAASAYMVSDDRVSIQDVIQTLFNGEAYVIDNQDMTLTLHVPPSTNLEILRLIVNQNLLPKPQGVRYNLVIKANTENTFGFADDPNAVGFADKFDSNSIHGYFAEKIII